MQLADLKNIYIPCKVVPKDFHIHIYCFITSVLSVINIIHSRYFVIFSCTIDHIFAIQSNLDLKN